MRMKSGVAGSAGTQGPAEIPAQPRADILEVNRWQLDHIRHVLKQAEAGEFATDDEVAAVFDRWRP